MKNKEHDDMMDIFNFIFGEPIGKVDDNGVYAKATLKRPNREEINMTQKRSKRISEMLDVIDTLPPQIKIDISELEEIQCKACKAKFQPNTEFHYVTKSLRLISPFSDVTEPVLHDAYDCPLCGSQIILGERLERLK